MIYDHFERRLNHCFRIFCKERKNSVGFFLFSTLDLGKRDNNSAKSMLSRSQTIYIRWNEEGRKKQTESKLFADCIHYWTIAWVAEKKEFCGKENRENYTKDVEQLGSKLATKKKNISKSVQFKLIQALQSHYMGKQRGRRKNYLIIGDWQKVAQTKNWKCKHCASFQHTKAHSKGSFFLIIIYFQSEKKCKL